MEPDIQKEKLSLNLYSSCQSQARVHPRGGGGHRAHASLSQPPLEIEKPKKSYQSNFKQFYLYFATFLVGKIIFSAIF